MKNNQAESDRIIQALESDNADALSFEEQQVHKLGRELRALVDSDLPDSNEMLREQLAMKVGEQELTSASTKFVSSKPAKSESRLGWKLALAGCVLLTVSVAALMMPENKETGQVRLLVGGNSAGEADTAQNIRRDVNRVQDETTVKPDMEAQQSGEFRYEPDANDAIKVKVDQPQSGADTYSFGQQAQAGQQDVQQQAQSPATINSVQNQGQSQEHQSQNRPVRQSPDQSGMRFRPSADRGDEDTVRINATAVRQSSKQELAETLKKALGDQIELNLEVADQKNAALGFSIDESKTGRQLAILKADAGRAATSYGALSGGRGGGGRGSGGGGAGGFYGTAAPAPATLLVPPVSQPLGEVAGAAGGEVVGGNVDWFGVPVTERADTSRGRAGSGRGYHDKNKWKYYRERRATPYYESGEQYEPIVENSFNEVAGGRALSTFSIDVDTASYSNMRRYLQSGQRPPRNAVRIEELVNYFHYDYPQPKDDRPFAVDMEIASCPWNEKHHLLRVGLKGKEIHRSERAATNLVFLLDVSGSMQDRNKLPLLKQGLMMMVQQLTENDSVSIVTYSGNAGVVLQPTNGANKRQIEKAIEKLNAGGSTNGSAGIEMAYELAQKQFIQGGSNRVILATDGDLNVGITDDNALVELIKRKASEGVFLTVLGFGTGNLKDAKLEKLADNGNGMYAYIDNFREAHKVLIEQMSGSLETIAKDVKIQIEFNPGEVRSYRLIGYENRVLAAKDFSDDKKDAGEIGAGHSVTALYELELTGGAAQAAVVEGLKYQQKDEPEVPQAKTSDSSHPGELLTLALRYKKPDAQESERIEFVLKDEPTSFSSASTDFQFAAAVASFGMILRGSQHQGNTSMRWVEETASRACGNDVGGYRAEFIDLVHRAGGTR